MMIYRNDPRFGFVRIIELLRIRQCQLLGEEYDARWWGLAKEAFEATPATGVIEAMAHSEEIQDARWYELAVEATTMDDIEEWVDGFLERLDNDWIEFEGSECPIDPEQKVWVAWKDDDGHTFHRAGAFNWANIRAYRLPK